jgi:hypothetical protein
MASGKRVCPGFRHWSGHRNPLIGQAGQSRVLPRIGALGQPGNTPKGVPGCPPGNRPGLIRGSGGGPMTAPTLLRDLTEAS